MTRLALVVASIVLLLHVPVGAQSSGGEVVTDAARSKSSMSARIDELVDLKIVEAGWQPADACPDAAFIRRAYLDLTGAPPKAAEVLDFIESDASEKRTQLIHRLVRSPAYAENFASIWAGWLVEGAAADSPFVQQAGLKNWLRDRFAENLRYDRLVADMLVASGPIQSGPVVFFAALEGKPEKIAARTARVFMGVQLDCAECHDHPFDRWKQEDFWGLAAYFAQLTPADSGMQSSRIEDTQSGEVTLPGTAEVVPPRPLVQTELAGNSNGTRRQQLTLWLTTRENPFLARATVNRVWAILMGRGLVEPVDDMRDTTPASHPELLNELSEYFTADGYDLSNLIEAIASTRAYSRDTQHASGTPPDDLYATMGTKPLSERQLANSVREVARQLGQPGQQSVELLVSQLGQLRGEASHSKIGIVSALVTLHGDLLDQTSSERTSRLLAALQTPHLDQAGQMRWLYLSTLNRLPTQSEVQLLSSLTGLQSNQPPTEDDMLVPLWQSDLLWALLNSTEFAMTP